jgi:hypothetical protein
MLNNFMERSWLNCVGAFITDAHDEILAVFTILLALFTLALWVSTARIANDAKTTGERTIFTMEDTARRQLRAYVGIENVPVQDADGISIPNAMGFRIQNYGQTPAHKLATVLLIATREFPLIKELDPPKPEDFKNFCVLNPSGTNMIIEKFTEEDFTNIKRDLEDGKSALYFWGQIKYWDVFDMEQTTSFCHFMNNKWMQTHRLGLYRTGNEAT